MAPFQLLMPRATVLLLALAIVLLPLCLVHKPARSGNIPVTYLVTDLGTLGGSFSRAQGINNARQVVGASEIAAEPGVQHAFLFSNGKMKDLGSPFVASGSATAINGKGDFAASFLAGPSGESRAAIFRGGGWQTIASAELPMSSAGVWALNDAGQAVGYAGGALNSHALLFDGGQTVDLGTLPGGTYSEAVAINSSGLIAGFSSTASSCCNGFLYKDGRMTDLGIPLGASSTVPFAINDSGLIAGVIRRGKALHAALFADQEWLDLGVPEGFTDSAARGINAAGDVVGTLSCATVSCDHAFVFKNQSFTDLNDLLPSPTGWLLEAASAINDLGDIVGWGSIGGDRHAFLLQTATPQDCTEGRWWRMGPPGGAPFAAASACLSFFAGTN